ncbi:VIR protein [Plasmodium vivax]|uniref:VIR protein n=1 Tax=Plasmodium vivax TaxID=5855 RepID=A0A1G4EEM9_PLAVI|nr:VIR protein [Plasmodium vivax]
MVAKSAPALVPADDLEKDATAVGLNKVHESFFIEKPKISENSKHCEKLDEKKKGAKDICNKAVHFFKEIAKKNGTESDQHCKYLPIWLYDEIGKIHENHKAQINTISFIKELTDAVYNAKGEINYYKCNPSLYEANITLDDWKNRKLSYIYFNKHDEIKTNVNTKIKDQCSKYLKYLNSYDPLYKKYYVTSNCTGWFPYSSAHFKCDNKKYDPNLLLTIVKKCSGEASTGGGSLLSLFSWGGSTSRQTSDKGAGTRQVASNTLGSGSGVPTKPTGPVAASSLSGQSRVAQQVAGSRSAPAQLPAHSKDRQLGDPEVQKLAQIAMAQSGEMGLQAQMVTDGSYPTYENSPESSTGSFDFLKKTQEFLKSDYFRHSIVIASAVGVFIFFSYFFNSSRSGSRSNKKKKSRRKPEYNYYDPNEEVLSMYGYEHSVADSQMDDVNLSYQPRRRDSYY